MNFLWQSKRFAKNLAQDWANGYKIAAKRSCTFIRQDERLSSGPVAMYGIQPETFPHWLQCRRQGRDFYYIDNAYLSPGHTDDSYVRITKNARSRTGASPRSNTRPARARSLSPVNPAGGTSSTGRR
jgi:hypothetical protein